MLQSVWSRLRRRRSILPARDGLGITIVYQALLKQLRRFLTAQPRTKSRNLSMPLPIGPEIGSTDCRFCRLAQREESQFLTRLMTRFQHVVSSDGEDWSTLHTELCLPQPGISWKRVQKE